MTQTISYTENVEKITIAYTENGEDFTIRINEQARGPAGADGTIGVGVPAGGSAGQALSKIDATDYNTQWSDVQLAGGPLLVSVKNDGTSTLTKGQVVYFTGANGENILIGKAQASTEPLSSKTIGFTYDAFTLNGQGYVITEGFLTGLTIPHQGCAVGDPIWLSPTTAGGVIFGLTNKPSSPNHLVYLGVVKKISGANVTEIYAKVQNGFELQEIHNVTISASGNALAVGDVLACYDSTTNNGYWKNEHASSTGTAGAVVRYSASGALVVPGVTISDPLGNSSGKITFAGDSIVLNGDTGLVTSEGIDVASSASFGAIVWNYTANAKTAHQNALDIGTGKVATQSASAVAITGGTITGLTGLAIRSTGAAFDLTMATSEALTAGRMLSWNVGNAARTITLSGNPTLGDWFDQSVKVAASPTFASITSSGGNVYMSETRWSRRGVGIVLLDGGTGVARLQLGGLTSAFPEIQRSGTTVKIRLADDSADAPFTASNITASGTLAVTGAATFTSTVTASGVISTGGLTLGAGSSVLFTGRSRIKCAANGDISFSNNADNANVNIISLNFKRGTGSPESIVSGSVGDIYTRTDGGSGTTLYVKESGSATTTGWVAK